MTRCMALVSALRALGRDAWLYADRLIDAVHFDQNWLINESGLTGIPWGCIVLDRFQTAPEELERWSKLAPVVGIDEGGVSRNCFDFLIDVLPGCYSCNANIADVSLLPLPEKTVSRRVHTEARRRGEKRVLVSFGQEDAAGLGFAVARALAESNDDGVEITLLWGELKTSTPHSPLPTPHSKILLTIPNLVDHLTEYDLVITHYGITAFEALYMGVPVLLVSPGAYHEKLAKTAGFYSLGVGKAAVKKLKNQRITRIKTNKNWYSFVFIRVHSLTHSFFVRLKDRCAALATKHNLDHTPRQSLAELINGITLNVSRNCPACGALLNTPALARYAERSYFHCAQCGIIAMNRLSPPPIEYGKEYFFELYQKQYGKTYIEDFPNLTALAKRRLAVIKSLFRNSLSRRHGGTEEIQGFATPRLLDIGCAYGPFLAATRDEGFSPFGIDPSEDAVRYVTETLGIPAVQGFFPEVGIGDRGSGVGECDVVTLWYVIEHFRDCVPVLAEIRKLLKPDGVLAFATPSFTGISGRASLKNFLKRSPADHWTIWSPSVAKKTLKAAGFTVKKIINSGHHPERFPALGKFARSKKSPVYWPLLAISRIFCLGDTFEVYTVRED